MTMSIIIAFLLNLILLLFKRIDLFFIANLLYFILVDYIHINIWTCQLLYYTMSIINVTLSIVFGIIIKLNC